MPIHDWTRVDAGLFHAFHHAWIEELARALNRGILPDDCFALPEQDMRGPVIDTKPDEAHAYVHKASHIGVRHRHHQLVSIIQIVSPGNKRIRAEFRALIENSANLIRRGIHLLLLDMFPPDKREPQGIHKSIWDEFEGTEIDIRRGKGLTLASYEAAPDCAAYVDFVGVGDGLPDMPLFLIPSNYVLVPLEATYQSAWREFPAALKGLLEPQ